MEKNVGYRSRGGERISLVKLCVGYKNGIIESKSGKLGLVLNCLVFGNMI